MASHLASLSTELAALVATAAPSSVAVYGGRMASSGIVWREGLVVTADETLETDEGIEVLLADGRRLAATLVGRDASTDVALLRINGPSPPAIVLDTAGGRSVGEMAVAIGRSEDGPTAALGIIAMSGPAWRSMRGGMIDAALRLDVHLAHHAEGGAAIDAEGRVIGMTVFGPRRSVLVIPTATIERVAAHLLEHGRMSRGYLGLGLQPIRLDRGRGWGLLVVSVDEDGPGHRAGVVQGDIITHWAGEPTRGLRSFARHLGPDSVGQTVEIGLLRGGESRYLSLAIAERPVS